MSAEHERNSIDLNEDEVKQRPNWKDDQSNVLLLIYMHLLRTLNMGFTFALPLVLQSRKVSYTDQSVFSLADSPASFKIFWAPIIDCLYWKKIGRRKSWLIPTQLLTGIILLLLSTNFYDWIGSEDGKSEPKIGTLTVVYFLLNICGCSQELAVEGWGITMLQKKNVGYAASASAIGLTGGFLIGRELFILLESSEFCNFFRSEPRHHGFVNFSDFMFFWSIIFLMSAILIFRFKKEKYLNYDESKENYNIGLKGTYLRCWDIIKLRPFLKICGVAMMSFVSFGPIDGVADLKLLDAGISRSKIALFSISPTPVLFIVPLFFGRFMTQRKSLQAFHSLYLFRLLFDVFYAVFIFLTPNFKQEDGSFPIGYYGFLFLFFSIDYILYDLMWMFINVFVYHIADPRFGAIYICLSHTATTMGYQWSRTISRRLVNVLTVTSCTEINEKTICQTKLDGFYVEMILYTLASFVYWQYWMKKQVIELGNMDKSAFKLKENIILDSGKLPLQEMEIIAS